MTSFDHKNVNLSTYLMEKKRYWHLEHFRHKFTRQITQFSNKLEQTHCLQ